MNSVALLAEGVDRNVDILGDALLDQVALLAEGVDRNIKTEAGAGDNPVALLAEGVDRNKSWSMLLATSTPSPSSRRAWIEIPRSATTARRSSVALLAEGVDRNWQMAYGSDGTTSRPPRGGRG